MSETIHSVTLSTESRSILYLIFVVRGFFTFGAAAFAAGFTALTFGVFGALKVFGVFVFIIFPPGYRRRIRLPCFALYYVYIIPYNFKKINNILRKCSDCFVKNNTLYYKSFSRFSIY